MAGTGFGTEFGRAIKRAAVAMLITRGDNKINPDRLSEAMKKQIIANYDQIKAEWQDAGEIGSDDLARNLLNIQANWIAAKAIQEYDAVA